MKILLALFFFFALASHASAQNLRAYFTKSVDHAASSTYDAQYSAHLDDTVKKFIDQAQLTLDIAVWDNSNSVIIGAINDAYTRGVQVRYITSSNALNTGLNNLNSNIPVLERNSGLTSNVMHNKFVIVDASKILTGSMNFGDGSIFDDYNNLLIVENQNLALNYQIEFNEMWGSTGAQPNLSNSKFGPDKTDNTTHSFTLSGSTIESYFSPSDNTTAHIVNAINSADYELDVAMFTFINNDLGDAVIAAKNRGVTVRCIIENSSYFGSEYNALINAGIEVISHASIPFDFHHKYCIVDAHHTNSDPLVVTGSHNWTNSAEDEYDENTLILHDYGMAQQYTEEFQQRWKELGGSVGLAEHASDALFVFPNPSNGTFFIAAAASELASITIFDLSGKLLLETEIATTATEISSNLAPGSYLLIYHSMNQNFTKVIQIR